ncbi:MAG: hypothetical protein Q9201_003109 [Fulgogasparrea decipioides]
MASLLRTLTGLISRKPTTDEQSLPYRKEDLEHNAAVIGISSPNNSPDFQPTPKLVKFQNLIGILSARTVIPGRPAPNPGIYKRTVDEEAKAHFGYVLTTYIVNCFFLLQIIVGAALTALGAAGGPSAAVTILGAFNTIVAGILTYLKGQGLPARLEQSLHLLRTLREHIEERERELTEPDCALDVDEVVQSIVQMYKEVRQSAEDNAPGNVLAPKGAIATLLKKTEAGNHVPTAEGMGGKSLGDKLKEAQGTFSQAVPAMKHGLEDIKAVRMKAEQEIETEQQKLQQIMAEARREKDHIMSEHIDVDSAPR